MRAESTVCEPPDALGVTVGGRGFRAVTGGKKAGKEDRVTTYPLPTFAASASSSGSVSSTSDDGLESSMHGAQSEHASHAAQSEQKLHAAHGLQTSHSSSSSLPAQTEHGAQSEHASHWEHSAHCAHSMHTSHAPSTVGSIRACVTDTTSSAKTVSTLIWSRQMFCRSGAHNYMYAWGHTTSRKAIPRRYP
jgi:hypothetical protein